MGIISLNSKLVLNSP